jgi:hypothetical protein
VNVDEYLASVPPWTRATAEEWFGSPAACACAGSPIPEGEPRRPCYCELNTMRAQRALDLPVVGWPRDEE